MNESKRQKKTEPSVQASLQKDIGREVLTGSSGLANVGAVCGSNTMSK